MKDGVPQRAASVEGNARGGDTRCNELHLFLPICTDMKLSLSQQHDLPNYTIGRHD
jgi:hypothetical protein